MSIDIPMFLDGKLTCGKYFGPTGSRCARLRFPESGPGSGVSVSASRAGDAAALP
ncbi:MAG: hypothetical protein U0610_31050 [bacterium]